MRHAKPTVPKEPHPYDFVPGVGRCEVAGRLKSSSQVRMRLARLRSALRVRFRATTKRAPDSGRLRYGDPTHPEESIIHRARDARRSCSNRRGPPDCCLPLHHARTQSVCVRHRFLSGQRDVGGRRSRTFSGRYLGPMAPSPLPCTDELRGTAQQKEVDPDVDLRILAVGDSFTFGPYVPNEDTWPGWLEHVLNARLHPRERVQVLNGGVAGYTVRDEYYYLAERGLGLEPDVVVVALFPNDISDFESLQREYLARPETTVRARSVVSEARAVFARLESRLAILQLATRAKRTMQAEDVRARQGESSSRAGARRVCDPYSKPDASDPCWQGFALWLRRTISLLRDSGTSFLIVAIPDQSQLDGGSSPTTPQEFIGQICSGERAPFLNLLPFLAELEDSESVYLQRRDPATGEYVGNAHMSSYGYRQIARLIADELEKLGVVPPR